MVGQGTNPLRVRYLDFGRYHGKQDVQGSTNIRMKQLESFWDELRPYKYGEKPDVMIFQKVYCTEDYKFPAHLDAIKILDICDPDWLDGTAIVETCNAMDIVTCPTEALATFLRQFHNNVHVIPDRFDTSKLPPKKRHDKPAKEVAWFGYAHNAINLKPAMKVLDEYNLKLRLITNEDPYVHQWSDRNRDDYYTFVRYDEETFYQELRKADFALLPEGFRPQDTFKSNNKTVKAILAGLPVAKTKADVESFLDPTRRRLWLEDRYDLIKTEYDVRESVQQYKDIINNLG